MSSLKIQDLHVHIAGKPILKGFSLEILPGQIHVLMGPNGAGKSTLAKVLAGDPNYEVTAGEIWFKGQNIIELDPEERAHLGLFMSFQYPVEIPGVSNRQFLLTALNAQRKARGEAPISEEGFDREIEMALSRMKMHVEFAQRNLNEGFSGGEKKRNEILQLALFNPVFAVLDETDSGLDIDAMRIVAEGVKQWMTADKGLLLITHYQRLLDYLPPHFVHVLVDGAIVQSGGPELALQLEKQGYNV